MRGNIEPETGTAENEEAVEIEDKREVVNNLREEKDEDIVVDIEMEAKQ